MAFGMLLAATSVLHPLQPQAAEQKYLWNVTVGDSFKTFEVMVHPDWCVLALVTSWSLAHCCLVNHALPPAQPRRAPTGAARFEELVKGDFFTDIKFFRVVNGFMAQFGIAGDPAVAAKWKTK